MSLLILLALVPQPSRSSAAAPATHGLTLDYHVKAVVDDHPEVILSVHPEKDPGS